MITTETAKSYVAIVDDDESICRSLSRLLLVAGLQPVAYSSAEAFLADNKHPGFDCLVLDVQLGVLSGIELSQQLVLAGSTVPVIFLTAHDEPELREQAMRTSCLAYLSKTEPGDVVLATIREAIQLNASSLEL